MRTGPRNSVIAYLRGEPYDILRDDSEWVVAPSRMSWDYARDFWPELWVDRIHDHIHEGD